MTILMSVGKKQIPMLKRGGRNNDGIVEAYVTGTGKHFPMERIGYLSNSYSLGMNRCWKAKFSKEEHRGAIFHEDSRGDIPEALSADA